MGLAADARIAALQARALRDDTAYRIIDELTTRIGPRPDGSEQEARARTWAVMRLKAMGFKNVHIEPYILANVWQRGVETAEVVSPYPQPLRLTALGNSAATPAEGLTLPVVYFADLEKLRQARDGSLKGKIAFVSNTMYPTQDGSSYGSAGAARFVGPSLAAKRARRRSSSARSAPITGAHRTPGSPISRRGSSQSQPQRCRSPTPRRSSAWRGAASRCGCTSP